MNRTLESITHYLSKLANPCEVSGYLCLDDSENVLIANGTVGEFDLSQLSKQKGVVLSIPFLEGLLPTSVDSATVIGNVHIDSTYYFDIHLFNDELGYWILFIDTTQHAQKLQEEQQERLEVDFINDKRKTGI